MTKIRSILLIIFAVSVPIQADSIWARRSKTSRNIYNDDVARCIGDILTIEIEENGKIETDVGRDLSKVTDRSHTFNGQLGIQSTTSGKTVPNETYLPRIPAFNMTAESENTFAGSSAFDDERKITDEITVIVQDVLPNGNLVVLGNRHRDVTNDKQMIQVSGIVRPSDIAFDNTVSSEKVANFHMVIMNEGVSSTYNKVGWLGHIMDVLWPF